MIISSVKEIIEGQVIIGVGETPVSGVCKTLSDHNIGAALIVEGEALRGIFTERDAVIRIIAEDRIATETHVDSVMTPEPKTIGKGSTLVGAVDIMGKNKCRHLPVVDGERVVGVLSMRAFPSTTGSSTRSGCRPWKAKRSPRRRNRSPATARQSALSSFASRRCEPPGGMPIGARIR